jgi:hypothetical protein
MWCETGLHGAEVVNATLAEWVSFITCRIRARQGASRLCAPAGSCCAARGAKALGQA